MLWVGKYNHPTGDDIFYGADAHLAWEETGSVGETILAAAKGAVEDYYRWQGTFVAMLIMRMQPTVFSEKLFFLTPFIVLGLIPGGSLCLLKNIAKYILPVECWDILAMWSVTGIVMTQWVFSVGEAFYWYNSSVYYGGFFGILLFGAGWMISYLYTSDIKRIPRLCVVAILLGGSNYVTLLLAVIVLTMCVLWTSWKRKNLGWGCW